MMERLFVYGSLAPGCSNAHLLSSLAGSWEAATVCGEMDPQGWGKTEGYPGLILDPQGSVVRGSLFCSEQLAGYWETLDAFEGPAYTRCLTQVKRRDGSSVAAYVYALAGEIAT